MFDLDWRNADIYIGAENIAKREAEAIQARIAYYKGNIPKRLISLDEERATARTNEKKAIQAAKNKKEIAKLLEESKVRIQRLKQVAINL